MSLLRNPTGLYSNPIRLLFLLGCSCLLTSSVSKGETLHKRLQEKAPEIVKYLNDHNLKTVGVLKFRVQKPGEKTSDSTGPLNSLLADRLEVALILENPINGPKQLNIIKDASSQVAKVSGATHLTKEGRLRFFEPEFELAWVSPKMKADAFLTGIIQVNEDRKSAKIGILCFDRTGSNLERIGEAFDATLDAASVSEMGESFVLRGAFDDGSVTTNSTENTTAVTPPTPEETEIREQKVVEEATRVRTQLTSFPLQDTSAPVKLEVFYDSKPIAVEFRDGQAFVREPNQGQKVEMAISRADFVKGTLGVVLKVNGENTMFRQTKRDIDCAKWLLTPDHVRTVIKGYQTEGSNVAEQFTVLSESDSAKLAVDYGRNVGQIQLTVFREQATTEVQPAIASYKEEDLAALLRGTQPAELPQNADALKDQIRSAALLREVRGGLIVGGNETESNIELKTFTPDPLPIMSATITYYSVK